jgi:hypothetical protein
MTTQEIINLALLLLPILLIQLGLVVYALVDLSRRDQVRGQRWAWGAGLVLTALALPTGIIIAGLYLAYGRNVEVQNDPC